MLTGCLFCNGAFSSHTHVTQKLLELLCHLCVGRSNMKHTLTIQRDGRLTVRSNPTEMHDVI